MPLMQMDLRVALSGPLVFTYWLPQEADAIAFTEEGVEASFWFVVEEAGKMIPLTSWPLEKTTDVRADEMRCRVRCEIDDDIKLYIENRTYPASGSEPDESILERYELLGRKIYDVIHPRIERLLEYAYSIKGQYWISGIGDDKVNPGQFFIRNNAAVSFGKATIFTFNCDRVVRIRGSALDNKRLIAENEWSSVREFVIGRSRSPLVGYLLARARELAEKGFRRTSIIEAVSALEIRLNNFADEYKGANLNPDLLSRLEAGSFKAIVEKLGFRGSFAVGLPLFFSEQELPNEMLSLCRSAIESRNNLIHNNGRDVREADVLPWLCAIEGCCERFSHLASSRN